MSVTAAEQAYRDHWARLLALLTAELRDLDLAEEALQDAFAAAVAAWSPEPPGNPPAWLLTAARRRALDRLRHGALAARKLPLLIVDDPDPPSVIPDERLRLIFTCCHPALSMDARVALTLRCVGGLTTREIARMFLVSEATMAARITRAKKKIAQAGIPYRVPAGPELAERRDGVLATVYLIFTEGYAATGGDRLIRADLAAEAVALGRMLRELLPADPEVDGLLALMLCHHARRDARLGPSGELVRLPEQDRSRWHREEIREALSLLAAVPGREGRAPEHAEGGSGGDRFPGPYLLQAAIAAEHATAVRAQDTDWPAIARLYGELERLTGSAVVRLNRAVAVAEASGPEAGLELLGGLDRALGRHHLLHATRAEFLRRLGREREALDAYGRALEVVGTDPERTFLLSRRADLSVR
ncbi:RNA polymerase sigma factor [Planobispora longispora]|uniref:RNA polymerase subunit sigma-24 n=1 Tax=Planobispora longispora TaxID=28887 RepID=A0A8J3RUT9_9ACTN|nr:sigma-70 family RNA polymerase sigma factor [Planobispora longispora]GIH80556.1 RNA polymerase subunit sigma-24 [Planobispora longispora]